MKRRRIAGQAARNLSRRSLTLMAKSGGSTAPKPPRMCFIINPHGDLIYQGAIDDHNSTDAEDIPNSKNYVSAALDEALAGKPVSTPSTRPYGCSVKYR